MHALCVVAVLVGGLSSSRQLEATALVMPGRSDVGRRFGRPWVNRRAPPPLSASVRLDAPLVHARQATDYWAGPPLGAIVAAIAAAAGAISAAMLLSVLGNAVRESSSASSSAARFGEVSARLRHFARLRWGTVRATMESLRLWWASFFEEEPVATLPEVWAPCSLEEKEIEDDYARYRLALKAGPGHVLPLALGQELTVMCLDDKNRPVRANFPVASNRRDPSGTVDIVVPVGAKRDRRAAIGALDADQLVVSKALDRLAPGGEAAIRAGRKAFDYKGSHLPITTLQCFVEELGAIPVAHLLQESLTRGQSTVTNADVYCINAHEDDFVLYDRLEDLYYKFHRKMTLACVVDDLLYHGLPASTSVSSSSGSSSSSGANEAAANDPGPSSFRRQRQQPVASVFDRNDDLRDALRPWQPGVLAVVAGPPPFASLVRTCVPDPSHHHLLRKRT